MSLGKSVFPNPSTSGLTKRELFAMSAMQALLGLDIHSTPTLGNPNGRQLDQWIAAAAVEYADALLTELAKDQP